MMRSRTRERGSAMMMSLITVIIMIGIAGTYLGLTMWSKTETLRTRDAAEAAFLAEAAAGNFINALNMEPVPALLPVAPDPTLPADKIRTDKTTKWLGGWFLIEEQKSGSYSNDDYREFLVTSEFGSAQRRLQVVISRKAGGVFWNAIYAQNSSGSDNYTLAFGGKAGQKDVVKGDVYSGGKLKQTGDAQLLNEAGTAGSNQVMYASDATDALDTAGATQATKPNFVNGSQPSLDIQGMNYGAKAAAVSNPSDPFYDANFVNVSERLNTYGKNGFAKGETGPNQGLGIAKQITDQNDPAHIFRLNPKDNGTTDRVQSYSGTKTDKNNYFLEDPTRKQGAGSAGGNWLGSDGGQRINVQPSGNNKVYYIDGNLWVSNSPAWSFQFENNTGADMKMTFIVKGNVYLTDNLLYDRSKKNDAIAIIAIKDDAYENRSPEGYLDPSSPYYKPGMTYPQAEDAARDFNKQSGSGNIFFGDPGGGTTERFESFMFAENNFYDHNMGASGTNLTNIYGNMTAGNHVQIKRLGSAYKPMQVTFDDRLRSGATSLPGLPGNLVDAGEKWRVVGWNTNPQKWSWGTVDPTP